MKEDLLNNWEKKSAQNQKKYKDFLKRADKNKVLKALPDLHEEAFEKINCLECANCCRNYSPRFKTPDIKRISKHLKMKEGDFIETYLTGKHEIMKHEGTEVYSLLSFSSCISCFPVKNAGSRTTTYY